jgi:NhaA family Na+:H+ antiporter
VWHYHVQVALLLFGLVNAGVVLHGYGNGTWATLLASVAGRTLGIAAALALAVMLGLRLPAQLRWRDITVVALAAGAGVTFTLFFATTLYPAGPFLAELKLGALLTGVGVPLAFVAARALHVGRFRDAMRPDSYAPDRHRRALP